MRTESRAHRSVEQMRELVLRALAAHMEDNVREPGSLRGCVQHEEESWQDRTPEGGQEKCRNLAPRKEDAEK